MSCPLAPLRNGALPEGFCAFEFPVTLQSPRSVVAWGTSNFLVLERGTNSVVWVEDSDDDGVADSIRRLVSASRLNHGLALHGGFIYASSDTTVFRWPYFSNDEEDPPFTTIGLQEVVVDNINADGNGGAPQGHTTRTLIFDDTGRLYVSVGSFANVDPNSFRSRIRRFPNLDDPSLTFPIDFLTGQVFADGLRNEVGLAFDRHGVLWGVENGADNLQRSDIGGDITNDNPAEELNRFPEELVGAHFGYPYCWSEYLLPPEFAMGRGTVWAWPSFLNAGTITDEECRANYVGAEVSMQAHSAPLGIVFYEWKDMADRPAECRSAGGAFPREMDGYAFIAFHGSWNRDIPTGYKVVYVAMNETGRAIGEPVDLLAHDGSGARWDDGFRPVDVDFDDCGRLLVTSDGTRNVGGSKVVRIEYHGESNSFEPTTSPVGPGTLEPSTAEPSTSEPSTAEPSTSEPSTMEPSTSEPSTLPPTSSTLEPTMMNSTTLQPTKLNATTLEPTMVNATTLEPTMVNSTTLQPTTVNSATLQPTTTANYTTLQPSTLQPTTTEPTMMEPTTTEPTKMEPTLVLAPLLNPSTTRSPPENLTVAPSISTSASSRLVESSTLTTVTAALCIFASLRK